VTVVNVALWIGGVALAALGYTRAKGPWAHYQSLKESDANAARYNAWRGGVREDSSSTGAAVAMQILRRRWQQWGAVGVLGIVLVVAGFVIK
jgi:hypothetical protein